MKYIKVFENFEIVDPINYGEPLNNKEINFLQEYNIMCPEWILKDDNYYYIFDHRCENIKDVPWTYINAVCSKYRINNYTINDDYTVDVNGDVNFYKRCLAKIPFKFNIVSGYFDWSDNKLTTLEGSPKSVYDSFDCGENKLTTLKGSPDSVNGNFYCSGNKLTTLDGGPTYVGGFLDCRFNQLISWEYKGIIKGGMLK